MPSTKDIDILSPPFKILFVAPNGFGKSICAAGFHKMEPLDKSISYADFDIRMKPISAYYPGVDIRYTSYTSDNFETFVTWVHDVIDGRHRPDYKVKIIDSMTSLSSTCVVYQLKVKDKVKSTKGGMPATSWDEINGETVFFHEVLEACQILYEKYGVTIIWTAHPVSKTEIIKGNDAKKVISLAAYGNKIPSIVPGFFDEIYNLNIDKRDLKANMGVTVYRVPNENMPGKTALFNYLPESFDITGKNFYEVWSAFLKEK